MLFEKQILRQDSDIMLWIPVTLLAVVAQLFRNVFSKQLSQTLHPIVVSLCRFLYGLPIITVLYFVLSHFFGVAKIVSSEFFLWILLAAICQIIANTLWVSLFCFKNFAVSISYVKTEVVFVALLGVVILAERISLLGWIGIIFAFSGLFLTSLAKERIKFKNLKKSLWQKSSYIGLLAGIIFAVATIAIKKSFLFLESDFVIVETTFAVWCTLIFQVLILIPCAFFVSKKDTIEIFMKPTKPIQIGMASSIGSFFWYFALAITYVAYVKTLGQIEFVLGILMSAFYFKEKIYKNEFVGMAIMAIGTILLVFS